MNREIHYLYGGNGLAAIYVKTAGKDTLFAAVTDRQNSLTAVMDVATGKIEKFSYKPWGMRRNPANWSENVVTDYPARFSRGYCMHEHMPQLGLINMGGRIFDERTNQFLSADPYRQAPESWLNCNRFGYCMGNPVMYTDPDGEEVNSYYDFSSSNCGFSSTSSYISTIYGIQNGNGTYEYTSFNNQYGVSTIPSILNSNCDYASIYASCNPVNNMPSFISAQQSVDRAYAQVQQGIQNAIACANATAANAQTVSVSLGQSGRGVNPLTITGMPSNTGTGVSSPTYDQNGGYVIMGFGNAYPFSDSYNSSTAKYVYGCEDFSWFPTSYSNLSMSKWNGLITRNWRRVGIASDYLNYLKDGFVNVYGAFGGTTNPGATVSAPQRTLVNTIHDPVVTIQEGGVTKAVKMDTIEIYRIGPSGSGIYDSIRRPAR